MIQTSEAGVAMAHLNSWTTVHVFFFSHFLLCWFVAFLLGNVFQDPDYRSQLALVVSIIFSSIVRLQLEWSSSMRMLIQQQENKRLASWARLEFFQHLFKKLLEYTVHYNLPLNFFSLPLIIIFGGYFQLSLRVALNGLNAEKYPKTTLFTYIELQEQPIPIIVRDNYL